MRVNNQPRTKARVVISASERNRMAMSALPFVYKEMGRYFRGHREATEVREDVVQDLVLFLMRAAESYRPGGEASYLTYVRPHIYPQVAASVNRNLRMMPARRHRTEVEGERKLGKPPETVGLEHAPEPEPVHQPETVEPKFRAKLLEGLKRRTRADSAEMFVRVHVDGELVSTIGRERCVSPQAIRARVEKVEKHFWRWAATVRNEAA